VVLYPGPDKEPFAHRFLANYLEGYRTEMPLDTFWLGQLPHFLKLIEIGVYYQVRGIYDPQDRESWVGRFMPGRRERIEHGVPYVDVDFASFALGTD
jgi:hypothetical protein